VKRPIRPKIGSFQRGRGLSIGLVKLIVFGFLVSCTSRQESEFQQGQALQKAEQWRKAAQLYDQVVKRDPQAPIASKAMKEAARIHFFQTKDYKKAADFYQLLVIHASDESERLEAQKELASIYFENLQNYERSAIEYSKLATSSRRDTDRGTYKLAAARSYYYLGNYFQTVSEINEILNIKTDQSTEFQARLLMGNVFVAQKNFQKAAEVFKHIIEKFPERALKENVYLVLSLSFEENGDYSKAQEILESIKDQYQPREYIELRLKRIRERARNQPGARGYRK
jgi:tetratricopeptide (TPR) repeat protein